MATSLTKELALTEDLELGFGASSQARTGNKINAEVIPYDATDNVKSALDSRPTESDADIRYAKLHGESATTFSVADGVDDEHAVNKGQLDAAVIDLDTNKADITDVIIKGAGDAYTPSSGTDPVNKNYADGLIADKFLGAITGKFIAKSIADGTTNVTVTVTNGVITEIL